MRPINTKTRWIAVASCLLAISSVAKADEGVVRITDSNQRAGVSQIGTTASPLNASKRDQLAAYARVRAQLNQQSAPAGYGQYQQVGYRQPTPQLFQQASYATSGCGTGACGNMGGGCNNYGAACGGCQTGACQTGSCQTGHCGCDNGKNRRNRKGNDCQSCDSCYADGYNDRLCTLFARATPDDGCSRWGQRWWRGQSNNYHNRNQKLANHLFGWMVPSGCGGQGCPPFGKYQVTYANDPGYADSRDGQVYGAQGYGTHMSVPLAPNVRQSYNYSWGTPASRITPIGHYAGPGPATANSCQSW